jgi:hypothetical protein
MQVARRQVMPRVAAKLFEVRQKQLEPLGAHDCGVVSSLFLDLSIPDFCLTSRELRIATTFLETCGRSDRVRVSAFAVVCKAARRRAASDFSMCYQHARRHARLHGRFRRAALQRDLTVLSLQICSSLALLIEPRRMLSSWMGSCPTGLALPQSIRHQPLGRRQRSVRRDHRRDDLLRLTNISRRHQLQAEPRLAWLRPPSAGL